MKKFDGNLQPLQIRPVKVETGSFPPSVIKEEEEVLRSFKIKGNANNAEDDGNHMVRFDGPLKPLKIQRQPPSFVHNKKFSCDICKKGVGTKGGLIYHMKAHLFGKPFKCKICSRSYATKNDFDTHYKRHAGQTFSCDVCTRKYKVKQYLADHISAVHLPKVIPCMHCKKKFASKGVLCKHISTSHSERAARKKITFLCKLCGVNFIKKHYQKHCIERELLKYKCLLCAETFTCYTLLVEHRRKEQKERSFCKICKMAITNVKQHFYNHHGNFQCDICPFKTNKSALHLKHQKRCGNKEQIRSLGYHCEICDQYFRSKFCLETHKNRKHWKFKCLRCFQVYHSLNTLKNHEIFHKKHHKNCHYKCVLCPELKNFSRKNAFDSHFLVHLNTLNPTIDGNKKWRRGEYMCDKCRYCVKNKSKLHPHLMQCYKINKDGI